MSFLCFHYYFCHVIHFGVFSWFIVNLCVSACGWASLRTPHLCRSLDMSEDGIRSSGTGVRDCLWATTWALGTSGPQQRVINSQQLSHLSPWGSPSLRRSSHKASESVPLSSSSVFESRTHPHLLLWSMTWSMTAAQMKQFGFQFMLRALPARSTRLKYVQGGLKVYSLKDRPGEGQWNALVGKSATFRAGDMSLNSGTM